LEDVGSGQLAAPGADHRNGVLGQLDQAQMITLITLITLLGKCLKIKELELAHQLDQPLEDDHLAKGNLIKVIINLLKLIKLTKTLQDKDLAGQLDQGDQGDHWKLWEVV
jgi:hypothetical protein